MRYLPLYAVLAISHIAYANSANGLPPTISVTVYTTVNYPIHNPQFADKIYHLDAVERLEDTFSQHLSENPMLAEQQAKQRLNSPQGKQFEQQLTQAYEGITDAWKKGIMKVPAVLFEQGDNPHVIYGEQNIASAVQRFRNQLQAEGK